MRLSFQTVWIKILYRDSYEAACDRNDDYIYDVIDEHCTDGLSHVTRNLSLGFPTRSDTNQALLPQKI